MNTYLYPTARPPVSFGGLDAGHILRPMMNDVFRLDLNSISPYLNQPEFTASTSLIKRGTLTSYFLNARNIPGFKEPPLEPFRYDLLKVLLALPLDELAANATAHIEISRYGAKQDLTVTGILGAGPLSAGRKLIDQSLQYTWRGVVLSDHPVEKVIYSNPKTAVAT